MSDDDQVPTGEQKAPATRPTISQPLAEKIAGLQAMNTSPGLEKVARVLEDIQAQAAKSAGIVAATEKASGISAAANLMARAAKVNIPTAVPIQIPKIAMRTVATPEYDEPDLTSSLAGILDGIDWEDMPEARAARAAEQTAKHLEVLVEEVVDGRIRSAEAERRKQVMLRWTIAGVLLAAIAAIASILTIIIG